MTYTACGTVIERNIIWYFLFFVAYVRVEYAHSSQVQGNHANGFRAICEEYKEEELEWQTHLDRTMFLPFTIEYADIMIIRFDLN